MSEPVTLESGRTFERDTIEHYFKVQRETAARAIANADHDAEDGQNLTEADFIICPINMTKVDPEVKIANKFLREATEQFLDEHPWAFEFDPRQSVDDIKLSN